MVKNGPGFQVRYHWDRDVLLSETRTDNAGKVVTFYSHIPGGFRPVGHTRNGVRFHYDADQRSLVREVYDDAGQEVARYRYRAYGERVTISLQDRRADTPFRLLGQFYDPETELHYNRFRYYESAAGRFLSSDLYVHEVAHNPYAYRPNPIGWAGASFGLMANFSQSLKDTLTEENKEENSGFYTCEHCGFQNKQKIFATTKETGRPVGDGSFHIDHAKKPNCESGPATRENAAVLGGTVQLLQGKTC